LQYVAVLLLYMAVKLHPACGKLLFSLADLAVGQAIELILKSQSIAPRHTLTCAALWLLNPVAVNISTRGSCDALTAALVLLAAKGASGTQCQCSYVLLLLLQLCATCSVDGRQHY
jgi:hypothetical protein